MKENRLIYLTGGAEGGDADTPRGSEKFHKGLSPEEAYASGRSASQETLVKSSKALDKVEDPNARAVANTEILLKRINPTLLTPVDAAKPDGLKLYQKVLGFGEGDNVSAAAIRARTEKLQSDLGFSKDDVDGILGEQTLKAIVKIGGDPTSLIRTADVKNAYVELLARGATSIPAAAKEQAVARAPKAKAEAATLASRDTAAPAQVETAVDAEKARVLKAALSLPGGFSGARSDRVADFPGVRTRIEYNRDSRSYTVTVDDKAHEYTEADVAAAQVANRKPTEVQIGTAWAETAAPASRPAETQSAFDKLDGATQAMIAEMVSSVIGAKGTLTPGAHETFTWNRKTIHVNAKDDGSYEIGEAGKLKNYSRDVIDAAARLT